MEKTLKQRILELLKDRSGLTDREMTDILLGRDVGQQAVNQATRQLEKADLIRRPHEGGLYRNYLAGSAPVAAWADSPRKPRHSSSETEKHMTEDELKTHLQNWLKGCGWEADVRFGHERGIDVDARRAQSRWIIEAKGAGKYDPMRVNYFLGALGELLRRMDDPDARYSIALPDISQYRRLWSRIPTLAKERMHLTALFVSTSGRVEEVGPT